MSKFKKILLRSNNSIIINTDLITKAYRNRTLRTHDEQGIKLEKDILTEVITIYLINGSQYDVSESYTYESLLDLLNS